MFKNFFISAWKEKKTFPMEMPVCRFCRWVDVPEWWHIQVLRKNSAPEPQTICPHCLSKLSKSVGFFVYQKRTCFFIDQHCLVEFRTKDGDTFYFG
jgi:hypothetical protein